MVKGMEVINVNVPKPLMVQTQGFLCCHPIFIVGRKDTQIKGMGALGTMMVHSAQGACVRRQCSIALDVL